MECGHKSEKVCKSPDLLGLVSRGEQVEKRQRRKIVKKRRCTELMNGGYRDLPRNPKKETAETFFSDRFFFGKRRSASLWFTLHFCHEISTPLKKNNVKVDISL